MEEDDESMTRTSFFQRICIRSVEKQNLIMKKSEPMPITEKRKRRVAAYARVSTDSDEQFTSYEAQIDYYTKFIQARDDWEFVKVYTDVDAPYGQNTNRL